MELVALDLGDVASFVEGLDDVGSSRGAPDTVLLHRLPQALVLDESTSSLHCPQECRLGIILGWLGLLLLELGSVATCLSNDKGWEGGLGTFGALLFSVLLSLGGRLSSTCEDDTPARL